MQVNHHRKYISHLIAILLLIFSMMLTACMDDDLLSEYNDLDVEEDTSLVSIIQKQPGIFIVNEGNFMYENSSLSYYLADSMKVLNSIFFRTNDVPLGDVAHSITIRDSLAYIVVNNSAKVYVININNFKYRGKITGLTSPRYIHFISDSKAYITDLYAKAIAIVNPLNFEITGKIDVNNHESEYYQHPTEQMVQYENFVFTNCWSYDNKILVIDTRLDEVVDSIEVLKQPTSLVLDKNNKIWTITDGGFAGNPYANETPGLIKIDAASRKIEKTFYFEKGDRPLEVALNGTKDTLYFVNKDVYRMSINDPDLPSNAFIETKGVISSIGINPYNSDIYLGDAIDNVQQGVIYRYTSTGAAIDTFKAGIIPGHFAFHPH